MKKQTILLSAFVATAAVATAQMRYQAEITELNGSGVSGVAMAEIMGDMLQVDMLLTGLETGVSHIQHVHGLFSDGAPSDSMTPPPSADTDGDGFVEVLEGVPFYGDIILPLSSPAASGNDPATEMFPMPMADGSLAFSQTYDLTDEGQFFSAVTGTSYTGDDLMPLWLREVVIHGMTVDGTAGAGTGGEIDGTAGFKAVLPVAAGEFMAVPEPSAIGLMGILLTSVMSLALRRRRS